MKAFIFDPLWDELVTDDLLKQLKQAGVETIVTKEIAPLSENKALFEGDEERILCLNPDYVSWKLSADDYKDIPNLKGIFGAATAVHWIDMSYANTGDIPICDIKNFSTESVAEWAIMMMFNVARQIPLLIKNDFPLDFDKDYMKYRGVELKGKKVGVIGLGYIGSAIANRCAGLGMEVLYWNRSPKDVPYKSLELSKILKEADVIFPALSLNDDTKKLLTDNVLATIKPTAMLIAIEHHTFSADFVLSMVKEGKLYGFGFEAEPEKFGSFDGNVWAAPAYAWATDQTMYNAMVKWVENMTKAAEGKFPNRVN